MHRNIVYKLRSFPAISLAEFATITLSGHTVAGSIFQPYYLPFLSSYHEYEYGV